MSESEPTTRASTRSLVSKPYIPCSGWQNMVVALGLSVEDCLIRAGLSPAIAGSENACLTAEEMLRFWDTMEAQVGPELIISRLRSHCMAALLPLELAAMASPDLRTGLIHYAEYKRSALPLEISLLSDGDETAVNFDWLIPPERLSHSLAILAMARILDVAERCTGHRIRPTRAECVNADEIPLSLVERHLGTPLQKGPRMCLVFSEQDLQRPLISSTPQTLEILERHFENTLPSDKASRTDLVRLWMKRQLPVGVCDVTAAAAQFGCSSRNLQRELKEEGTSFSRLLDDTRHELALHYLARDRYAPKEVGFLLGYSELAAFHRAFRRWTGETPNEYSARTRSSPPLRDEQE